APKTTVRTAVAMTRGRVGQEIPTRCAARSGRPAKPVSRPAPGASTAVAPRGVTVVVAPFVLAKRRVIGQPASAANPSSSLPDVPVKRPVAPGGLPQYAGWPIVLLAQRRVQSRGTEELL